MGVREGRLNTAFTRPYEVLSGGKNCISTSRDTVKGLLSSCRTCPESRRGSVRGISKYRLVSPSVGVVRSDGMHANLRRHANTTLLMLSESTGPESRKGLIKGF